MLYPSRTTQTLISLPNPLIWFELGLGREWARAAICLKTITPSMIDIMTNSFVMYPFIHQASSTSAHRRLSGCLTQL